MNSNKYCQSHDNGLLLLRKTSILFAVLFIAGCTSCSLTHQAKLNSKTLPKSCSWPPIQLSSDVVSSFHWSNDGQAIIYHQEADTPKWFSYHLSDGNIKELPSYLETTPTQENAKADWGIMSYDDLFIYSDRVFAVYTQINPNEEYTKDVYLTTKEKHATLLGRIKGLIDQHIWLNGGQQLILSIDWQSRWGAREAYAYLIPYFCANRRHFYFLVQIGAISNRSKPPEQYLFKHVTSSSENWF